MGQNVKAQMANRGNRGFGLIEVMIAVTLGLMVTAVITSIFLSANKSYQEDDQFARLQENGRFAVRLLVEDISMAGMWGTLSPSVQITSTISNQPCGVPINTNSNLAPNANGTPLRIINNADRAKANKFYSCISTGEYWDKDGNLPDVLMVRRTKGTSSTGTLNSPAYVEVTKTPLGGKIVNMSGKSPASGRTYWEYLAHIYYIRNYSNSPNDGIPTLCRKSLVRDGVGVITMQTEPLIEGVENFQIEFGVDDPGRLGTNPDWYTYNPIATPFPSITNSMTRAVNAKLFILVRTLTKDRSYVNTKSYRLGTTKIEAKNDRYHRRVFSTVVSLRNITSLAAFQ